MEQKKIISLLKEKFSQQVIVNMNEPGVESGSLSDHNEKFLSKLATLSMNKQTLTKRTKYMDSPIDSIDQEIEQFEAQNRQADSEKEKQEAGTQEEKSDDQNAEVLKMSEYRNSSGKRPTES